MPVPFCAHIQDFVDQPLACFFVDLAEDATGDLDQIAVEFPLIPPVVHVAQLVVAQTEAAFHQVVCLGQKLHQRVLDAVVDRLDKMAGRPGAEVSYARVAVDLGGHRLKQRADPLVGLFRSAGHDARAVARSLFAAGHAHAEKLNALRCQITGTQIRILEVGISGVDDQVALVEVWQQVGDHGIHGRPGGHQHHDRAWRTE